MSYLVRFKEQTTPLTKICSIIYIKQRVLINQRILNVLINYKKTNLNFKIYNVGIRTRFFSINNVVSFSKLQDLRVNTGRLFRNQNK